MITSTFQIELVHTIAGNAQNQNILINVILLDPKYVTDQSRAFYHSLAMITGGLMYQSPRRAAHELIPIIESRFQPDQVTIVRNQRIQATRSGVYIDVPGMIIIFFSTLFYDYHLGLQQPSLRRLVFRLMISGQPLIG